MGLWKYAVIKDVVDTVYLDWTAIETAWWLHSRDVSSFIIVSYASAHIS